MTTTYYSLVDLFDEDKFNDFLLEPGARLYGAPGVWGDIAFLIYYYRWVSAGKSDAFIPRHYGIHQATYDNIFESLQTLKNTNFKILCNTANSMKFLWGEGGKSYDKEPIIIEYATSNLPRGLNYLPPDVRKVYVDTDDFCMKCADTIDDPEMQDKYRELYFHFKLWAIDIYDENGKLINLEELCWQNMEKICSKNGMVEAERLWMKKGLTYVLNDGGIHIPPEIFNHIASFHR